LGYQAFFFIFKQLKKIKVMKNRFFKQCEDCDGEGTVSVGPNCSYPASMCCGGCYDEEDCDTCNGSGEVEDTDIDLFDEEEIEY